MIKFSKPELHFVRNTGDLSGDELAKLSDEEFSAYLRQNNYQQQKKKYRISPGYVIREIAGQHAIVPVAAGEESPLENTVMAPNDTAVFIWKSFERPSTVEDVVVRGLLEYQADESRLRSAVEKFVTESLAYKVLEEVE